MSTSEKRVRPLLSRDDVDALLAACSRRGPSGLRNRALIAMLATSGARIGEALSLVPANLQRNGKRRGELSILTSKKQRGTVTENTRTVKLPESTRAAWSKGWRTFRVRPEGSPLLPGEIDCPAVTRGVSCADCKLCFGAHPSAPSVSIEAHGGAVQRRVADRTARGVA